MSGLSHIDIYNMALIKLGATPITSFEDETKEARYSLTYHQARKSVFRSHYWNCLIRRIILTRNEMETKFGELFIFPVPSDYIMRVKVNEHETILRVENNRILATQDELELIYVSDEQDATKYDTSLVDVIVSKLAFELALPMQQSASRQEVLMREYEMKLKEARFNDAREGHQIVFSATGWTDSRKTYSHEGNLDNNFGVVVPPVGVPRSGG